MSSWLCHLYLRGHAYLVPTVTNISTASGETVLQGCTTLGHRHAFTVDIHRVACITVSGFWKSQQLFITVVCQVWKCILFLICFVYCCPCPDRVGAVRINGLVLTVSRIWYLCKIRVWEKNLWLVHTIAATFVTVKIWSPAVTLVVICSILTREALESTRMRCSCGEHTGLHPRNHDRTQKSEQTQVWRFWAVLIINNCAADNCGSLSGLVNLKLSQMLIRFFRWPKVPRLTPQMYRWVLLYWTLMQHFWRGWEPITLAGFHQRTSWHWHNHTRHHVSGEEDTLAIPAVQTVLC